MPVTQGALSLQGACRYGCLGFSASRFFARPLAELVTAQGRDILQNTVDLVHGTIGAEVQLRVTTQWSLQGPPGCLAGML